MTDRPVESASFDLASLHAALDAARAERHTSWTAIGRTIGVAPSTIRRTATAANMEADGVLAMIGWLGVEPERFTHAANVSGVPLPDPDGGMIRVDITLVNEAVGPKVARTAAGRTSIQELAAVAARAGRPIASFTRRTAV